MWNLHVRNAARERIAQVEDYQSFDASLKFNEVGGWILELPANCAAASYLDDPGAGIILDKDGVNVFSGPVTGLETRWDEGSYRLTVTGSDDNIHLDDRIVHPIPSDGDFSASAYDTRTDVAETIIKEYVDYNLGPSALAPRRVGGLTIETDAGLGSTVTGKGRLQNLLAFIGNLAVEGGDLGFKIAQVATALEFQVYDPEDKTATIIFSSELGNLRRYTYGKRGPSANYVFGAGGGTGTGRTFVENSDPASITNWRRIERVRDRRDTTDTTIIGQTITGELEANAEKTSLEVEPIDTEAFAYLDDYDLGDIVTVVLNDGTEIQQVVREVGIKLTPEDSIRITPRVGSPKPVALLDVFDDVANLEERVTNLESI